MYHFIVNTKSRTGKTANIWKELECYLKKQQTDYMVYQTEYEGHGKALATEICKATQGEICMVVVGGDGTINEVLNGITDFSRVKFAVIPLGSGNDFARGLGIKKRKPLEVLKQILSQKQIRKMDIGHITYQGKERYFGISAGLGIDAYVCKEVMHSNLKKILNAIGLGSFTYICLTVKSLFTMPTTNAKVICDDTIIYHIDKMIFIAAMNHPTEGGGVPMAPRATAFDGKLSLCLVYGIPRWRTFFLLPILAMGKHEGIKGFEIVNCNKCKISIEDEMVLHTDGEYLGMQKQITVESIEGKIQLLQ